MAPLQSNGSDVRQLPPLQLAFPLPSSPDTRMHLHLTAHSQAFVLLVHTSSTIVASSTANLSSFVYALPNQLHPDSQPLSTPLYTSNNSVDFASRLARMLAKKSGKPTYVGASDIKFWAPEDESAAMKGVLDIAIEAVRRATR